MVECGAQKRTFDLIELGTLMFSDFSVQPTLTLQGSGIVAIIVCIEFDSTLAHNMIKMYIEKR